MHVINLKLDTFDKVLNVPAIIGVRETPLIFIAMLFTDYLFYIHIYQQFNFEFQTVILPVPTIHSSPCSVTRLEEAN